MNPPARSPHRPRAAWPALLCALAFGAVEWLALARSRARDRLLAARRCSRGAMTGL